MRAVGEMVSFAEKFADRKRIDWSENPEFSVMAKRSRYQQKIIKNYYQNREAISLQRVQELVTELYLATGKKRAKLWDSLPGHLEKLGVKQPEIDHVVAEEKPELVAKLVERLMNK